MVQRARVVVVGAGFAGLAATKELARTGALVTLVDRNPYATFQPLLYQVATAGMGASDVSYPIRTFTARWPNVRSRRAGLSKVLPGERRVEFEDGSGLDYDYLVLATGVTTNWLGVSGAQDNALPIYSLRDAAAVRDRLGQQLEDIALGRRQSTHVVVVGGGATGVEMAGTLAELRRRTLPLTIRRSHPARPA
ncbi:NAD(P)/FAD-dependent oxidoreductase [Nonomuraea polychroma]|uniref:NAD(P)/FAD-dependent oxidoreductase n=1 Tax=Nonomuraea polychroma TaxID=46176 RepID=UPI003D8B9E34